MRQNKITGATRRCGYLNSRVRAPARPWLHAFGGAFSSEDGFTSDGFAPDGFASASKSSFFSIRPSFGEPCSKSCASAASSF
eukprot:CAMPEP_0202353870 /NCGR_PEP_ID=MMETSP1126-20121109/9442_1 /ASSEMBLY_ACC=CAM_ASM_000457 /TAXON_ID=3047 /ORGANISM="Dunaliella tertiolecta, Strain CCMP1320" /LENGTH=81 /DNA_ID=CAMNT_0048946273 /DNA_START=42 /DNA_END=284 /DNA_ORIENTATION=-